MISLLVCGFGILGASVEVEDAIFEPGAKLEVLAADGSGGEGPAWHPEKGLFTSGNGNICLLDAAGKSTVFRKDAGTNGLLFDAKGRLIACEPDQHRVTRTELDGKITVLADKFTATPEKGEGKKGGGGGNKGEAKKAEPKRFNSPNDVTVDSQGRIYFSDPRYGKRDDMEIFDSKGRTIEGVYRIDGEDKVKRVVGREVERANGVLVSPNDQYLFVADNNNDTVGGARKLWRFQLKKDGTVDFSRKYLVYDWGKGRGPDGVKQDAKGRLYVAAGLNKPNPPFEPAPDVKGGIYVLSEDGKLLAFLPVPTDEVTNCAFGGDDLRTLFITAGGAIYRIRTVTPGRVVWPPRK
jgi:gluconolactonase